MEDFDTTASCSSRCGVLMRAVRSEQQGWGTRSVHAHLRHGVEFACHHLLVATFRICWWQGEEEVVVKTYCCMRFIMIITALAKIEIYFVLCEMQRYKFRIDTWTAVLVGDLQR